MMYFVTWEIDIEAETPRQAAEQALAIQRNPDSIATMFKVAVSVACDEWIDLREKGS